MSQKNTPTASKTELSESHYLRMASHHPLFVELNAMAKKRGVSWQYIAREAMILYCTLHRTSQPIIDRDKG